MLDELRTLSESDARRVAATVLVDVVRGLPRDLGVRVMGNASARWLTEVAS